jgi:hypothetical protein
MNDLCSRPIQKNNQKQLLSTNQKTSSKNKKAGGININ